MRFLLDECVSPLVAPPLAAAGHSVVHARDLGLTGQTDAVVLAAAESDQRVLVTLDTDFGALLAASGAARPSIVYFRGEVTRRPAGQVRVLLANLDQFTEDIAAGAVVVIGDDRVRVRRLPIN